jgi:hypothetical protein
MHIYNCQTSPVLTSKISSPAHSISSILASYNDVQLPMAVPSPRKKKLSAAAAAVLLLVILTAGTVTSHISSSLESLEQLILSYVHACLDTSINAESTEGFWDGCNEHLSGAYKGPCWPWIKDDECARVCIGESWDNISGTCRTFQCFCWTGCDDAATKVLAPAATTPIQP